MTDKNVLQSFQFDVLEEPKSIYPFSPVYKVEQNGKSYIVKHTQSPIKEARKVVSFIEGLKENEVSVVTPVPLLVNNPQQIGDDVWIVYPFINGEKYTGKKKEIYQAGKLLGQIHASSSVNNEEALGTYNEFDFEADEITEDVSKIKQFAEGRGISIDDGNLKNELFRIMENQGTLEKLVLPSVATPYDYKANNLIYNNHAEPFLIDPDHATFLPRLYDIALALLLFHNELDTAPTRIFDVEEWILFKSGYFQYVKLTGVEKAHWLDILKHVYMDEVIWMLGESEEDWDNQNQLGLFKSLLAFFNDIDKYDLE